MILIIKYKRLSINSLNTSRNSKTYKILNKCKKTNSTKRFKSNYNYKITKSNNSLTTIKTNQRICLTKFEAIDKSMRIRLTRHKLRLSRKYKTIINKSQINSIQISVQLRHR